MTGRFRRRDSTWVDDVRGGLNAILLEALIVVVVIVVAVVLALVVVTVV